MIILDADLDEETIRAAVERWLQLIESNGRRARPRRLLGQAPSRLRDQPQGRRLLRGLPGPCRTGRRWTSCTGCSPWQTRSSATRCLRIPAKVYGPPKAAGASAGSRHREQATWQQTPTPSRSPGNITRDPEMRYTPSGVSKVTFGVAVNRSWRNQQTQEWDEQTSFFNVVALASARRERRRVADEGRARGRQRPARAAQLGDRAGREALDRRDRRRRRRPEPAVRDRRGAQGRAQRAGRRGWRPVPPPGAGGGRAAGAAATAVTTSTAKSRSDATANEDTMPQRVRRRRRSAKERRPIKKKTSILNTENIEWIDYKDVNLLRRFMSERAKIRARRVTGNDQQQQAAVAKAIKLAREMALLPYSVRQVTQRSKGRRDRGDGATAASCGCRERAVVATSRARRARRERSTRRGRVSTKSVRRRSSRRCRLRRRGRRRGRRRCGRPTETTRDEDRAARRRRATSARRATSSTSPTATPATSSCRAGSR